MSNLLNYHTPGVPNPSPKMGWQHLLDLISQCYWIFLAVGLIGGMGYVFSVIVSPFVAFYGILITFVALVGISRARVLVQRRRLLLILNYLHGAVSLNLPINDVLTAAEQTEGRRQCRPIRHLRLALSEGVPMGRALLSAMPWCPRRIGVLLDSADQNGTLESELQRLMEFERQKADGEFAGRPMRLAYYLMVLLAISGVTNLIYIFVFPKFAQIFKDFHVQLTPGLRFLARLGSDDDIWLLCSMMVLLVLVVGIATRAMRRIFRTDSTVSFMTHWFDALTWRVPVWHAIQRDLGLADVCNILADGLAGGRDAPSAIALAAGGHLNRVLWRRVQRWAGSVQNGATLALGARDARLPALLVAMLSTNRAGDHPASLRFLADYYGDRHRRLVTYLQAAATPVLTLLLGVVVMSICFTLFDAMQRLILATAIPGAKL